MLKKDAIDGIKVVAKQLEAMSPPVGMPSDCILHDKSKFKKQHHQGRARWVDDKGRQYTWDALHGEIEMFNKNNKHMGSFDKSGNPKKGPVKGRILK